MSARVCKDGMDLSTLFFHFHSRQTRLVVPAQGYDSDRYDEAKKTVLDWIAVEGSSHKHHVCNRCSSITSTDSEKYPGVISSFFILSLSFLKPFSISSVFLFAD